MAMTLRLSEQDARALAEQSALEHRSQQEIVTTAVREYIERTSRASLLEQVLNEQLPRYAEALERLGQ